MPGPRSLGFLGAAMGFRRRFVSVPVEVAGALFLAGREAIKDLSEVRPVRTVR